MKNPTSQLAREIIANGEIGEIKCIFTVLIMKIIWLIHLHRTGIVPRHRRVWGLWGILAAHIVNMAHYLVGDITSVSGDMQTVIRRRPDPKIRHRFFGGGE